MYSMNANLLSSFRKSRSVLLVKPSCAELVWPSLVVLLKCHSLLPKYFESASLSRPSALASAGPFQWMNASIEYVSASQPRTGSACLFTMLPMASTYAQNHARQRQQVEAAWVGQERVRLQVAKVCNPRAVQRRSAKPSSLLAPRMSTGFGVRWFSPLGPLRFEWGYPLTRMPWEESYVFEFTIGNFF